jgi:small subunit ribosomal protein S6
VRTYETTFIINPQSDDATIDRQVTEIVDIIKQNGGNIVRENRMGTRRLAYEIKGLAQGYYTSLIYEGNREILPALDRHFKLEEPYLRSLTIRFEGPIPAEEDSVDAAEERPAERAPAKEKAPVAEETAKPERVAEEPPVEAFSAEPEVVVEEVEPEKKTEAPVEEPAPADDEPEEL